MALLTNVPAIRSIIQRIELPPNMTIEVVTYPESERGKLLLRIGNRYVWTWTPLTPEQAREVAMALINASAAII